ncbi:MAG: GntR family transcriptional regulator [Betaproteobacteria bacterium]|nr:GntR family transcriptional regulator [Betaproteobacteria bacterium]
MATKLERICDTVIARIESGALREGDRLPSEEQLAASLRASVGTVQKALQQLAHRGLIVREHGRGTFVSGGKLGPADVRFLRFRNTRGEDLPLYLHVLSVKSVRLKGPWAEFLATPGPFIRIERMISVGGEFDLFSEFFLPESEFAALRKLDAKALERISLRDLLKQQFSVPTLRADQFVRFEVLPARVCDKLGLRHGVTGFVMEMRGYTLRDRPLYFQKVSAGPFGAALAITR